MSIAQASSQLIEIINESLDRLRNIGIKKSGSEDEDINIDEVEIDKLVNRNVLNENTIAVGLARIGRNDQNIKVDTIKNLSTDDLGAPLHSLIIAGKLHPLEIDFLKIFYNKNNHSFQELVDSHNKFYSN